MVAFATLSDTAVRLVGESNTVTVSLVAGSSVSGALAKVAVDGHVAAGTVDLGAADIVGLGSDVRDRAVGVGVVNMWMSGCACCVVVIRGAIWATLSSSSSSSSAHVVYFRRRLKATRQAEKGRGVAGRDDACERQAEARPGQNARL